MIFQIKRSVSFVFKSALYIRMHSKLKTVAWHFNFFDFECPSNGPTSSYSASSKRSTASRAGHHTFSTRTFVDLLSLKLYYRVNRWKPRKSLLIHPKDKLEKIWREKSFQPEFSRSNLTNASCPTMAKCHSLRRPYSHQNDISSSGKASSWKPKAQL